MAKLGLLETDTLYDDLLDDYRSYGTMFARFFDSCNGDLDYRFYEVQQGELPKRPDECDAYLITGSKAGVYDDLPWLPPLRQWIIDFYQQRAKLIGICFGHQMVAHSLGGHAEKCKVGWGAGVLSSAVYAVDEPQWLSPFNNIKLIHSHQDQVIRLPAGAKVLAGSEFCPYAVMALGDSVLTFQGHPEFNVEYFQRLIHRRKKQIGANTYESAIASLGQSTHAQKVGQILLGFIKQPSQQMK